MPQMPLPEGGDCLNKWMAGPAADTQERATAQPSEWVTYSVSQKATLAHYVNESNFLGVNVFCSNNNFFQVLYSYLDKEIQLLDCTLFFCPTGGS